MPAGLDRRASPERDAGVTLDPPSTPPLAPGLLISAPASGCGKTTITLGLQRALRRRGLRVAPVKNGPDYIDPAFHAAATGRSSLNLDGFAMSDDLLDALAVTAARDSDIVIAEGAMGLFDGVRGAPGRTGASADLAARFGWPVLLVLDVSGQAQSAGAVALGCARFDPRITIAGVILNKVASPRHRHSAEDGLKRVGMPVLGAIGRDKAIALPSRHLGLVQAGETADLDQVLERLADIVDAALDLDAIVALAATTLVAQASFTHAALRPPGQRIALARDAAFSFIYPHVIAGWRTAGAEIVPFSPLSNEAPPADCDCCWLPGGYPELHAGRLAAAVQFKQGLRGFAETRPVHGECGGYMVLGRALEDEHGAMHSMTDLLPVTTSYARRHRHLGYRIARLASDCSLGQAGDVLAGHEYHYCSVLPEASAPANLAGITDADGVSLGTTGHRASKVSGTFFHAIAEQRSGA
jgi:cobyrinic acid a,c-diamide synthase